MQHRAVSSGNVQMTNLLIAHGADVNVGEFANYTPLHYAAERDYGDLVELLIAAGAEIDAKTSAAGAPGTPLDWAVRAGQEDVAELLRQHGATSALPAP